MIKPYLVFMAGPNSLEDIIELISSIKNYIRGINCLLHDLDEFSEEAEYILKVNNELGAGNVIFGTYVGDHSHSRNRILKECKFKTGDRIVSLDLLERIPVEFANQFDSLFLQLEQNEIDVANFYAKPYLILYREDMLYIGTPHESLISINVLGRELKRIELNQYFPDENKVRINMRPIKRDKFNHIEHYIRYILQPNSNQNMLGIEHRGGREELIKQEKHRENIVFLLDACEFPRNIEGMKKLLQGNTFCKAIRDAINENGWINNFYRYHTLGEREGIVDTHDWSKLPQF